MKFEVPKFNLEEFIKKVENQANTDVSRKKSIDGKLDEPEKRSIFNSEELKNELTGAVLTGALSQEDAKEIFGLQLSKKTYKLEPIENSPTEQVSKTNGTQQEAVSTIDSVSKRVSKSVKQDLLSRISDGGSSYYLKPDEEKQALVLSDTINWDGIAADMRNDIASGKISVDVPVYNELINAIETVANAMKGAKYNSRADVEKLYNQISKELNISSKDKLSDFKKNVLKNFVEIAEKHQQSIEYKKVYDKYNELRKGEKSREDAMKELRNSSEFKGSYYGDYYGLNIKDIDKNDSPYKHQGMISQMEDSIVLEEARNDVMAAIWALRGRNLTTSKEIEEAAKALLGDKNDKYTAKIFNGDLTLADKVGFKRSTIKDLRKAVAAYNRVEQNKQKTFSKDELLKASSMDAINKMSEKGLITTDNNGKTFNIAQLSDLIRDIISPADYRANAQNKDLKPYSEIDNVVKAIQQKTGAKITKQNAKDLIDLCGFDRDKKDLGFYLLAAYKGSVGGLAGAVANLVTATSVGFNPGIVNIDTSRLSDKLKNYEFPINIISQNDIKFDLTVSVKTIVDGVETESTTTVNAMEIMRSLAQQGFKAGEAGFEIDGSTIRLWIDKSSQKEITQTYTLSDVLGNKFEVKPDDIDVDQKDPKVKRSKAFFAGLAISMAFSVLNQMLKELDGERPIINTDEFKNFETYDECAQIIDSSTDIPDEAKQGLKQVAKYFWDKDSRMEGFTAFLKRAAGENSFLNKSELIIGVYAMVQEFELDAQAQILQDQQNLNNIALETTASTKQRTQVEPDKLPKHAPQPEKTTAQTPGITVPANQNRIEITTVEGPDGQIIIQGTDYNGDEAIKTKDNAIGNVSQTKQETQSENKNDDFVNAIQFYNNETVTANYHFGNKHTWQGIASLYAECKQHGHTESDIIREIKNINGIKPTDNVIAKDLYLPDFLFGENDGKKAQFNDDNSAEKYVYANDAQVTKSKSVKYSGTKIGVKRTSLGWFGMKGTKMTTKAYSTREAAEAAAKEL